jgi:hypothetical protein
MTDEERLHMITEQLIIVRDNLFRGMSKSMQKLQARSINEVLKLPNFTESPQRPSRSDMTWQGLTHDEIDEAIENNQRLEGFRKVGFAYDLEAILKEKNTHE